MDVTTQVNVVRRSIEEVARAGKPARVLVAERALAAPPQSAWQALTDAEEIPRWFLPVRGDDRHDYRLFEGGKYELAGNASGVVLTCEEPSRLLLTWEFGGDTSWVEVHLEAAQDETAEGRGGTVLSLVHTAHVSEDAWREFGPGAVGVGWDLALLALARHLTGRSLGENWSATPIGQEFVAAASLAWGKASVLAGTSVDEAAEAVQRTTAAYTTGAAGS